MILLGRHNCRDAFSHKDLSPTTDISPFYHPAKLLVFILATTATSKTSIFQIMDHPITYKTIRKHDYNYRGNRAHRDRRTNFCNQKIRQLKQSLLQTDHQIKEYEDNILDTVDANRSRLIYRNNHRYHMAEVASIRRALFADSSTSGQPIHPSYRILGDHLFECFFEHTMTYWENSVSVAQLMREHEELAELHAKLYQERIEWKEWLWKPKHGSELYFQSTLTRC